MGQCGRTQATVHIADPMHNQPINRDTDLPQGAAEGAEMLHVPFVVRDGAIGAGGAHSRMRGAARPAQQGRGEGCGGRVKDKRRVLRAHARADPRADPGADPCAEL